MYISLNWLKEFVDIPKNLDPRKLAEELTMKTAEIESITNERKAFDKMIVGYILELKPHPNADKLKIAKVNIGQKKDLQIVCGGTNLKEGIYVIVTLIGSFVRWHGEGEPVEVTKTKIRGVESEGMIAAGNEIGLNELQGGPEDIVDLSANKPLPGTPLSKLFEKDDTIFEFDNKSLTHRPDLWGHYGIAREIAAITSGKLKPFNPAPPIPKKGETAKVEVRDKKLCPRFCALIINNIKVTDSPNWLKKKLKSTGHGSHNNIVDATNYVMAEIGQPMHSFDKDLIKGGIIVRMAEKNEKLTCLDGKERILSSDIGVIADHEKVVGIAGTIGGQNSEINENTTSIILEAAAWHPTILRRGSIKLGVRTDAVQRFEKSLDPKLAELAIKRAAEIILKICPTTKIAGPMIDIKNYEDKTLTVDLDIKRALSKIGIKLSAKQIKDILEKLEFKVKEKKKDIFEITIPSFRATKDINIEDDLIEEVARIYGYENIPETLPTLPTKLPIENPERFKKHRAREILSYGFGLNEVYNYSFYGKQDIEKCLIKEEGHLKLLNFLSEDQTHLRISLLPNLLKNLEENVKNYDKVRIYEIGRTYKEIGEYFPLEEKQIMGAILVKGKTDNPFYETKGIAETFFKKFNIPLPRKAKEVDKPFAHPVKALSYLNSDAQTLCEIFMLHPIVAKNYDLEKYSIGIFNLNFSKLMCEKIVERTYKPIPKFPSIEIDISVVIDKNIEIETLENAIFAADKELIANVKLFDIYEDENIGKNHKAAAFKITLQASDRTLTDKEMSAVQKKIFKNLEHLGGVIRGK